MSESCSLLGGKVNMDCEERGAAICLLCGFPRIARALLIFGESECCAGNQSLKDDPMFEVTKFKPPEIFVTCRRTGETYKRAGLKNLNRAISGVSA